MSVLRSFFRLMKTTKKLVGSDQHGNKYYEVVSGSGKVQRSIESAIKHTDYQAGDIPLEWEAWVRGKRENPPTMEEIAKRENFTAVIQKRAVEVDRRDKERQQDEYDEGLVADPPTRTEATGHASVPTYGTIQGVEKPSSTGNEFEPASWEPPRKPK